MLLLLRCSHERHLSRQQMRGLHAARNQMMMPTAGNPPDLFMLNNAIDGILPALQDF